MNRSKRIIAGWLFAACSTLPLAGCQDAPAPAATPVAAAKNSDPKDTASKDTAAKDTAAKDTAPESAAPKDSATKIADAEQPAKKAPPPAANQPKVDITFDTIKLDMKKEDPFHMSLITPKIQALEGRRVKIRGYILPSFQQTGLTQFVLVRDNMQCCFGPGAAIYDCIVVEMRPGRSTDFTIRPVAVEGVFAVREFLDPDGKALAIYHLDGEAVQ